MTKSFLSSIFGITALISLTACDSPADVASRNLSQAAGNFEIMRRITLYNGITDSSILNIEGFCSIGETQNVVPPSARRSSDDNHQLLVVICKTGPNEFKKHYLGLSDNVTFLVNDVKVDTFHYRTMFGPMAIRPDINFQVQ